MVWDSDIAVPGTVSGWTAFCPEVGLAAWLYGSGAREPGLSIKVWVSVSAVIGWGFLSIHGLEVWPSEWGWRRSGPLRGGAWTLKRRSLVDLFLAPPCSGASFLVGVSLLLSHTSAILWCDTTHGPFQDPHYTFWTFSLRNSELKSSSLYKSPSLVISWSYQKNELIRSSEQGIAQNMAVHPCLSFRRCWNKALRGWLKPTITGTDLLRNERLRNFCVLLHAHPICMSFYSLGWPGIWGAVEIHL